MWQKENSFDLFLMMGDNVYGNSKTEELNELKLQIQFWQNYLLMKHQKLEVLTLKEFIKFQYK